MRKSLLALVLAGALSVTLQAASFTNGNFETGDLTGWTQGGGFWSGEWPINASDYAVGGSRYNASAIVNTVVSPGLDSRTDNNLNMVYSGQHSAKVNNEVNNNSISLISQTVNNYTDANIYFAWAAVLQESHGPTDSSNFTLTLRNDTTSTVLYNIAYNSASAASASLFTRSSSGWYYTDWQVQSLDVSKFSGDTFTLSLLASDCPYGGHAGYVYLDGFGAVLPPPTDIPEPATYMMLAGGLGTLALFRRRFAR
jgi:hypothetical protein